MNPEPSGPGTPELVPDSPPRTETPTNAGDASPAPLLARIRAGDRVAAAAFLELYGPRIRRRLRGKLSHHMRRVFDSQDLWSTIARRFDRFVCNSTVAAESEAQLVGLLNRMIDTAVVDKFRAFTQLAATDQFAQAETLDEQSPGASHLTPADVELAIESLADPIDREVLILWLQGMELRQIAEQVGRTPGAVRQRWQSIREGLRRRWFREQTA